MISLVSLLALRQIVFLVWVSLTEQKWVILGERRRPAHEALPYWRNWDLDEDLPGRPKYSEMPRVDWVAERLKRWLVGTHAGAVSQAQLGYYLDEFTFRFNARRCEDTGKLFERLLQQAVSTAPIPYGGVVAGSRWGR
jgi:hypothetical protein